MDHLREREVAVLTSSGGPTIACTVKFSFHCFTDHRGNGDDRPNVIDTDSHERDRVFCPMRWAWSHWLPAMFEIVLEAYGRSIFDEQTASLPLC